MGRRRRNVGVRRAAIHVMIRQSLTVLLMAGWAWVGAAAAQDLSACALFPPDHALNVRIDTLPVHPDSDAYINSIGAGTSLHPDFGSGEWPPGSGSPIGIPYAVVGATQAGVAVSFTYSGESDPGPYPIPANPPIEGGTNGTGDRHILIVDQDACVLYELFSAYPNGDGTWQAGSGAIFDLASYQLRPDGWTSADAAGLPILPALIRYNEAASGEIRHAIRFTASQTQRAYVWPARHFASSLTDPSLPPMGQRFRLKSSVDVNGFSPLIQVILVAMQRYGLILADNGSNWFLSGAPDERWDNDMLRELRDLTGSDFEAVDTSALQLDPDSGQARDLTPRLAAIEVEQSAVHISFDGLLPGVPHTIQSRGAQPGASWEPVGQWTPIDYTEGRILSPPTSFRVFRAYR